MAFFDDYIAASWKNAAGADRARGGSGTFADAMAIGVIRRSIDANVSEIMQRAGEKVASDLSMALNKAEAERTQLEEEREEKRNLDARTRASIIQQITLVLTRAQSALGAPIESAEARGLFRSWIDLLIARRQLISEAIDDINLNQEVARCYSAIEERAASARLGSFDDVLAKMTLLIEGLRTCLLKRLAFSPEYVDGLVTSGGCAQIQVPADLIEARKRCDADLEKNCERCLNLREYLRALIRIGMTTETDSGWVFSDEFAIFDRLAIATISKTAKLLIFDSDGHLSRFSHNDPADLLVSEARLLAMEDGAAKFISEHRNLIDRRFRDVIEEKRLQIALVNRKSTLSEAWKEIQARKYQFADLSTVLAPHRETLLSPMLYGFFLLVAVGGVLGGVNSYLKDETLSLWVSVATVVLCGGVGALGFLAYRNIRAKLSKQFVAMERQMVAIEAMMLRADVSST